jgi:hypothetical protein
MITIRNSVVEEAEDPVEEVEVAAAAGEEDLVDAEEVTSKTTAVKIAVVRHHNNKLQAVNQVLQLRELLRTRMPKKQRLATQMQHQVEMLRRD